MSFISFRADEYLKKKLEMLANMETRKVSDESRYLLILGLNERLKSIAVKLYQQGKLSLGKAAELAEVSVFEFIELLEKKGIYLNLEKKDILEAVEDI